MISRSRTLADVQTLTEQVSALSGMFHVLMIARGRVFTQYAALWRGICAVNSKMPSLVVSC